MTRRLAVAGFTAAVILAAVRLHIVSNEKLELASARRRIADGITRVVIVGDSLARGTGDESGRGIAGNLDLIFRTRRIPFAPTLNLGINGARTYVVRSLLRGAKHNR